MRRSLRAYLLGICLCLLPALIPLPAPAADETGTTVFAAASLTDALEKLAAEFKAQGGGTVRFSFAASSTLARQVEAGAPADIFVSANEEWMSYLVDRNLIITTTQVSPIGNELVLVAPKDSPTTSVALGPDTDLAALVGTGGRIATGDPAHVPVGIYAQKALEALGLWAKADPLLARADSVRAALALVERGEAPLGIVYASDAVASKAVKVVARFPASSHPPITYPFAIIVGHDTPEVRAFFTFITTGSPAAEVYRSQGFTWEGPTG